MLGLASLDLIGIQGAIVQMVSHGLTAAGLFLMVGMIYERCHTRDLAAYGGLAKILPVYSVFFMILTLASIGLPATSGFTGEFLVLLGAFGASWKMYLAGSSTMLALAASAVLGVVLGALYMLRFAQQLPVRRGSRRRTARPQTSRCAKRSILALLVVAIVGLGLFPAEPLAQDRACGAPLPIARHDGPRAGADEDRGGGAMNVRDASDRDGARAPAARRHRAAARRRHRRPAQGRRLRHRARLRVRRCCVRRDAGARGRRRVAVPRASAHDGHGPRGEGGRAGTRDPGAPALARRSRRDALLRPPPVLAVRRVPHARVRQLPHAVPGLRAHVAAGLRDGHARVSRPAQRGGRAQVPRAGRRRVGIAADGCGADLRCRRLALVRGLHGCARRVRSDDARGGRAGDRRVLPQGRGRALPCVGARCVRGCKRPRHCLHGGDREGRGVACRRPPVRRPHARGAVRRPSWQSCRWRRSCGATWPRCARRASDA